MKFRPFEIDLGQIFVQSYSVFVSTGRLIIVNELTTSEICLGQHTTVTSQIVC